METAPPRTLNLRILGFVALLGFTSGVPLTLTSSTLQLRAQDAGVDLKTVGFFALAGLPYTLKFLWSPLLDRYRPPFLGRRRGWILVMTLITAAMIAWLGQVDPARHLAAVAVLALAGAFSSASMDINIDAYRTELLPGRLLGPGVSLHINFYRIGMVLAGAVAMFLADRLSWPMAYLLVSLALLPGALASYLAPEPMAHGAPRTLGEAVVEPFREFLRRKGALEILAFILLYKLGDNLCTSLNLVFLRHLGFSKTELALAVKGVGLASLLAGAFLGGWLMSRWSLKRSLWVFGLLQMASMSCHVALALTGFNRPLMLSTIAIENSIFAMGSVAYVALIQRCCDLRSTATQFALLSSLSALARVLFASPAGVLADKLGWPAFFLTCMAVAIPGLLLLRRFDTWQLPEAG